MLRAMLYSLTGCVTPDDRFYELCSKIKQECDGRKMSALIKELYRVLDEERDAKDTAVPAQPKSPH
jgi:hypothetical protein